LAKVSPFPGHRQPVGAKGWLSAGGAASLASCGVASTMGGRHHRASMSKAAVRVSQLDQLPRLFRQSGILDPR
jgi:hypothetical protein